MRTCRPSPATHLRSCVSHKNNSLGRRHIAAYHHGPVQETLTIAERTPMTNSSGKILAGESRPEGRGTGMEPRKRALMSVTAALVATTVITHAGYTQTRQSTTVAARAQAS